MPRLWKFFKKFVQEYEAQIIIVVIFLLIFNPLSTTFYKSAALLLELVPNSNIKPLHFFTKEPLLKEVSYKSGEGEIYADLWVPNENGKHPAAVLQIGLDVDKRDLRIQRLAQAFARSGIIVLVPNIPTISQRRLTRESPGEFEESFKYLYSLNLVDKKKVGFLTFCGASGPAFISSQSKSIRGNVSFLVTIDPYFDLRQLYKEIVSKNLNGQVWNPHSKTIEIFNREAIFQLDNKADKAKLSDLLLNIDNRSLSNGKYQIVNPDEEFISQDARETYKELTNKNSKKSDYFLENAPEKQKDYLRLLSPSSFVTNFKPKVFILTEKPSPYLPYTQAESMHKALPEATFEEVSFTAADRTPSLGLVDGIKSFIFIWKIAEYLGV